MEQGAQDVQVGEGGVTLDPDQVSADFVIGDLGHENLPAGRSRDASQALHAIACELLFGFVSSPSGPASRRTAALKAYSRRQVLGTEVVRRLLFGWRSARGKGRTPPATLEPSP